MSNTKTILIIDDERDLVEALRTHLESAGWKVLTACDGFEGIEKAKRHRPDLILLDLIMPNVNGYQVCHTIKHDATIGKIPVIMLTARTQPADCIWGKEVGASDYITKPFIVQDLLHRIRLRLQTAV